MLYNRYYDVVPLLGNDSFTESIDVLFTGNSNEVRAQKIPSLLKEKYQGEAYSINYDIEREKYSLLKTDLSFKTKDVDLLKDGKDLISQFIKDLNNIEINDKIILIDITSLKHPIVFYLMLVLRNNFTPKKLFVCYTEPEKYKKIKTEEIDDKFDLTDKFCEVNSLPGFLRVPDHNKEKLLVAVMGFEGARFSKAFGDVNPSERKTYGIVGFPSFHPSWQYYVYSKNQHALTQSKAHELIKRATANEPFGIYNILESIKQNNPTFEITIAPIGTKPHSLGVSMFAINNKDVQIYYDFPSYGKKIRTIGVGKSFLYNLTDFINGE